PYCDESIRITSFNIHYLRNILDTESTLSRILEDINTINPTILILNEFPTMAFNKEANIALEELEKSLGFSYSAFAIDKEGGSVMGNYIFSKKPISQFTFIPLGYNRTLLHANIQDLHIYGTHLEVKDSEIRVEQAKKIMGFIGKQRNVILAGDMNSREDSKEISIFSNVLRESFSLLNWDKPKYTCWSGIRIDFAFVSQDIAENV